MGNAIVAGALPGPTKAQQQELLDLCQQGSLIEAEKLAVSITCDFASSGFGWKILAVILAQTGRASEALKASQTAVTLLPEDPEVHNNLGNILQILGQLERAERAYAEAIAIQPGYAEALANLGAVLKSMGKYEAAEASYRAALDLKTDSAEAHNNLGVVLHNLQRPAEAVASFRTAISLSDGYAVAYSNLGMVLQELGRSDEAKECYSRSLELDPESADGHYNLGFLLQQRGCLEEATISYLRAIALRPRFAQAYRALVDLTNGQVSTQQLREMEAIYLDDKIATRQRSQICFALARVREGQRDFAKAFLYYKEGNQLQKQLSSYDVSENVGLFDRLKRAYPELARQSLVRDEAHKLTPVFILGMPRSGTTLVEQIVSAHSDVTGAGELPFAAQFGAGVATGSGRSCGQELQTFRDDYLEALRSRSDGRNVVTDKMPLNFRLLGLLAASLPEAKFVHVKRVPSAVCWANYISYLDADALRYSNDLEDIVAYFLLYEELMTFWRGALGDRLYEIDYDLLTVNQEAETRKLISYLELPWQITCLSPELNQRAVSTASNIQVRQSVYQKSSEKWKCYQPFIGALFDHLDEGT